MRRTKRSLRWMAILLTAVLLFQSSGITAFAAGDVVVIDSAEDLVLLADNCRKESYSTGKTFRLEADIDLAGYENLSIPVMNGSFEGGGHTISGLKLTEEMSDYGLFRYVGENGSIRNLTVEGEVLGGDGQEHIGILAGSSAGTIENCVSRGTLNGETSVGGIAGVNEESGVISRCTNEAQVDGKMETGGIAGTNEGSISDCRNTGLINTSQKVAKSLNGSSDSISVSLSGAVTGLTSDDRANRTGGIAGSSAGSVAYCTNEAVIGHKRLGSSTGGIVGWLSGSLSYCENTGTIYGHKSVGGIVGVLEPHEETAYNTDYGQTLEEQLDELDAQLDALLDTADALGDHLSDNMDVLSERMDVLRESLRVYMDDYGELLEESRDSIDEHTGAVSDTLDGMQYGLRMEEISAAGTQISSNIQKMEELFAKLLQEVEQGDPDPDALEQYLEQFSSLGQDVSEQMSALSETLSALQGDAQEMISDVKSIVSSLNSLAGELGDTMDDFADEMEVMTNDLQQKSDRISDQLSATVDTLESDLDETGDGIGRIKTQLGTIRATVSGAIDELKERIEDGNVYVDVSELADSSVGDGKIISCENAGELYADGQGGGIVGTISKESAQQATLWLFEDSDGEDDEEEESGSLTRHLLAVVSGSVNTGDVTISGDYAGGVVGKADYGMVAESENYGDVTADGGSYAGGIAGRSENLIRDCCILGGVSADSCVGGVAGRGEDIRGCYVCSYLDIEESVKACGAVAGSADGDVEENHFVENGWGAVDGVTRDAQALGMSYESLMELKDMPEHFTEFTIRFLDGDEVIWEQSFSYGEELSEEEYPSLPESEDGYVYWEEKELSPIHRNVTVHAVYRAFIPSLTAGETDGKSTLLLGGEFYPDSVLAVREATEEETENAAANLGLDRIFQKYDVRGVYYYELSQAEEVREQAVVRVLNHSSLSDSMLTMNESFETVGEVQEADVVGDYLSVSTQIGSSGYIVVLDRVNYGMAALGVLLIVLAVTGTVVLVTRKKKKKKAAK
ncbi:MAG: hypothetical protein LUE31_04225 [Lachnospiraceae bacterium]|nr:hypothetical protein [Lachnospiraceae bacterium]